MNTREYMRLTPSERENFRREFPQSAKRFAHLDTIDPEAHAFYGFTPSQRASLAAQNPERYAEMRAKAVAAGLLRPSTRHLH